MYYFHFVWHEVTDMGRNINTNVGLDYNKTKTKRFHAHFDESVQFLLKV